MAVATDFPITAPTLRMTRRQYPAPPIIEALLDIQVAFDRPLGVSEIVAAGDREEAHYPIREPFHSFSLTVDTQAGTAVGTHQELVGYRYWRHDRGSVFQYRTNGVLLSKLPPYTSWEEWSAEARRLWEGYVEHLRPDRITRIAVRYVNRLNIPLATTDLTQYLRARPEVPDDLPLPVQAWVMRLEIPLVGLEGGGLVLQQGLVEPVSPDVRSVLLDLDLYRTVDLAATDVSIWGMLQELHDRENAIFESCITDEARGRFQ